MKMKLSVIIAYI